MKKATVEERKSEQVTECQAWVNSDAMREHLDGICRQSLYRLVDAGLPCIKIGNRFLFHVPTCDKWLIDEMQSPVSLLATLK